MKFKSNGLTLQKAVNLAEKAISMRSPLQVMQNLYLDLKGDKLKVRGNDLELSIEYTIPVENSVEDGGVLIKASTISNIVSKMENQKIDFAVNEDHKVTIKADQVDFEILGSAVDDYPVFPEIEAGNKLKLKVMDLKNYIKHTIFSVSSDETKQFLNGILFKVEENNLNFVATDGFRLALIKKGLGENVNNFSVIIPYKTMSELNKILPLMDQESEVEINISNSQVTFILNNLILVSRVVQGQFPDYKQVLPKQLENSFTLPRRTLIAAAERALIISSQSNNVVRMSFDSENLRIKANAAKMGEFKEDIKIQRQMGENEFTISFNIKLLLDAVKNIETDDLVFEFNNELSPCLVKPAQDDDYIYIIMPIRTSDYNQEVEEEEVVEAAETV